MSLERAAAQFLQSRRAMNHRALYSLHDVTPAKAALVFEAIAHLRSLGVSKLAMLVVPDFHGRADLRQHPAFCAELKRALGPDDEILLHGYYHLADAQPTSTAQKLAAAALTAGEGEFQALRHDEASQRIANGLKMLQDTLDLPVSGFVAPAWLQSPDVRRAVADAGLAFCEDQLRIWPTHGVPMLTPALSFASRTPVRLWASIASAETVGRLLPLQPVARLAVHPNDYRSAHLRRAITRVVTRWQTASTPSRYHEVLT
jgi:predicted deacetylase